MLKDRAKAQIEGQSEKLHDIIAAQQKQLDAMRRPLRKQRLPAAKTHKGWYSRVCIGDTHGSKCDPQAIAACLADLKHIKRVREIILLGDHIDCGGFLAEHHTLGYVEEMDYSFEQDCAAANQFLDDVQAVHPRASITYIEGNHEARLEHWCVNTALRQSVDAALLRRVFGPEHFLSLKKRGIDFVGRQDIRDGLTSRGVIRRGKCLFTHGHRVGSNAARGMLLDYKRNVVFGHIHRCVSYFEQSADDPQIGAWSPGCLSLLRPLWRHTAPTHWAHGYGLQIVQSNDDFLHLNIQIMDGVSLLGPLFEMGK